MCLCISVVLSIIIIAGKRGPGCQVDDGRDGLGGGVAARLHVMHGVSDNQSVACVI